MGHTQAKVRITEGYIIFFYSKLFPKAIRKKNHNINNEPIMISFILLRPRQRLRNLYSKILASVQAMPQDAAYRKYTEQLVTERINHVKMVS